MSISKLPRNSKFSYPNGDIIKGKVIGEVSLFGKGKTMDYLNLIQKLEMENKETWIRFAYYKRKFGGTDKDWMWGSQTTLTVTPKEVTKLIKKAIQKGIIRID